MVRVELNTRGSEGGRAEGVCRGSSRGLLEKSIVTGARVSFRSIPYFCLLFLQFVFPTFETPAWNFFLPLIILSFVSSKFNLERLRKLIVVSGWRPSENCCSRFVFKNSSYSTVADQRDVKNWRTLRRGERLFVNGSLSSYRVLVARTWLLIWKSRGTKDWGVSNPPLSPRRNREVYRFAGHVAIWTLLRAKYEF